MTEAEPMHTPIPPERVATVLAAADVHARRLAGRLRLPPDERHDLRQDLLVDLIRRLPAFDAERGGIEAFVQLVLRNHGSRIASRMVAERRARGGALLSIDVPLERGDPHPLRDNLAEEDSPWVGAGHVVPSEAAIDVRLDLGRALGLLPERDRSLCLCLAADPVSSLVRAGLGSRSGLYRRIAELRFVLAAHGLGPAWDDRAPT